MASIKHFIWYWANSVRQAKSMGRIWTDNILRKMGLPEDEIKEYHRLKAEKLKEKMRKRRELLDRINKANKRR